MASVTLTLNDDTTTHTVTRNLSTVDLNRLLAGLAQAYAGYSSEYDLGTTAGIVDAWGRVVFERAERNTRSFEAEETFKATSKIIMVKP